MYTVAPMSPRCAGAPPFAFEMARAGASALDWIDDLACPHSSPIGGDNSVVNARFCPDDGGVGINILETKRAKARLYDTAGERLA